MQLLPLNLGGNGGNIAGFNGSLNHGIEKRIALWL